MANRLSYSTGTTSGADENIIDVIKSDLGITDGDLRLQTVVLWTTASGVTVSFNDQTPVPLRDNGNGEFEINTESKDVLTKILKITQTGTEWFCTFTY